MKVQPNNYENGNVLVTALLILVVMNLLGIGLANISTKEWNIATYKSIDSEVFHMTETCSQNVMGWFEEQTAKPATVPDFEGDAEDLLTTSQSSNSDISHKLSGYSYTCDVDYIISKEATTSSSSGSEIGNSGGAYGSTGGLIIKDYYQITSTGSGPKNSARTINTIISVEY